VLVSHPIDASEIEGWLSDLSEFIAIPSVSADPERKADVRKAADWVCRRIQEAGGEAAVELLGGAPLTIGEVRASVDPHSAPTVLIYGHFDVQPVDPLDLWQTDPFRLDVRDGWIYGRGTADDKGQLFMLLEAVRRLAADGTLPVNVRFACEGEEEIEGQNIIDWIAADRRGADVCLIFDSSMFDRQTPAIGVGCRGLLYFHIHVRTGDRDLHSGQFGGAALNAGHALMQTLSAVMPRNGRLPEPLRAGTELPTTKQLNAVEDRFPGERLLNDRGASPADPTASDEFYLRTTAEPSIDVNGIAVGSPFLVKTVLPVVADANVSIRLAWRQDPATIAASFERMLREALPAGASLDVSLLGKSGATFQDPGARVIGLAQDAMEEVLGVRPLLFRGGGSLPVFPAMVDRGIPTIVTGFDLPEGNIHSPNERLSLELLPVGVATARALLTAFGRISTRSTEADDR
jgi:acetylornithine deacetylase/succinyl-diaminopimelate desuccinylase-like protein